MFDQKIHDELKAYVYRLVDPRTKQTFYVGKGNGNRCFAHAAAAIGKIEEKSAKLDQIRTILNEGMSPQIVIHRHGMTDEQAFEVEGALIDAYLGLTNEVAGHHRVKRGAMTTDEVISSYGAKQTDIKFPAMLIKINREWENIRRARVEGMTEDEFQNKLYKVTRSSWVVGKRREGAKFAISVAHGIIRQVYEIDRWVPCVDNKGKRRHEFEGRVSNNMSHLLHNSVASVFDPGAQNPIKYLNC
ncbi:MAG: hypothetical protein JKY27_02315 [Magnetovibrio sp.]|nr:hypothetical protein [Magnetovibrio sp.]